MCISDILIRSLSNQENNLEPNWEAIVRSLDCVAPGSEIEIILVLGDIEHCYARTEQNAGSTDSRIGHPASLVLPQDFDDQPETPTPHIQLRANAGRSRNEDWQKLTEAIVDCEAMISQLLKVEALQLGLNIHSRLTTNVLQRSERPCAIISSNGSILTGNTAAWSLFKNRRLFRMDGKQIRLLERKANAAFALALCETCTDYDMNYRTIPFVCSDGKSHAIHLRTLTATDNGRGSSSRNYNWLTRQCSLATFLIADHRATIDPRKISEFFGLTPAEGLLLASLASGSSLVEHCTLVNIKVTTGRWHLHNALQQTGCRNQTELVARVLYCLL